MWNPLINTGDAGVQILHAYTVKEALRSLLGLAGTNPERHIIRTHLDSFYQHAAATDAPEAHRLAATIEAWWPAIEAGILTGYSNSRSEGYNRPPNASPGAFSGAECTRRCVAGLSVPVPVHTVAACCRWASAGVRRGWSVRARVMVGRGCVSRGTTVRQGIVGSVICAFRRSSALFHRAAAA